MAATEKAAKSADAFRTISEVSDILEVPQHVLRFWEGKFNQIKPMKRGGNRRYYRPEDLELLRAISHLLYTDGYTIKGVQKLLRENGVRATVNNHIAQFGAFQSEGGGSDTDPYDQGADGGEAQVDNLSSPDQPEEAQAVLELGEDVSNGAASQTSADLDHVLAELKSIHDMLRAPTA
ncbi:MAG: MerR family transcriptional regulator [Sphingomonadales bacterium]